MRSGHPGFLLSSACLLPLTRELPQVRWSPPGQFAFPISNPRYGKQASTLSNQQFWEERGGEKYMNIIDLRDIIENKETETETYEAWKIALWDDAGYQIEDVAENEPTMIPAY